MTSSVARRDGLDTAEARGKICAVAMECLRDMQDCVSAYPALFSARPLGATVFSGVALAHAFGSPDATAKELRMATRFTLWGFAADWLLDYVASSAEEINAIVAGCARVGRGGAPDPDMPLECLLAGLRDELAARPHWSELRRVWAEHLDRYLSANAREWTWKTAHAAGDGAALPTFEQYLANADNIGASLVNVSHWTYTDAVATAEEMDRLAEVSAQAQQALRLLNDLASHARDVEWGDLNSLMLGLGPAEVTRRAEELIARCDEMCEELALRFPEPAAYLRRQVGHNVGFYGTTDYWGTR
ncbi:terpene synthase family protein [Actinoallomurus sp. CA-142502]|uniref:terpene synthase family protein n=1 Tax=Actinoallomurus sp. CA-142502 TaxID=3239885 RepID=UPI003D94336D